ncbi:hypothetical protein JMJ35_000362 [Cladonia borealis]|uniref:Uncharacterized protein n=1 Tax=Cladonia borealis TaxID=184061 RepID=A0AA39R935_9LECA|nr:hypothetical protein JMJ35_000362 [Cladonia borealis]
MPRGFLPTEVNIGKPPEASASNSVLQHHSDATACHQSSVKVDTVVPTTALSEPVPSIKATGTEAVPPKFSPVNDELLTKSDENEIPSIQVTSTEAVPPKSDPVNVEPLTKLGENGNSSIQATATKAIHPKPNPVNVEPLTKSGKEFIYYGEPSEKQSAFTDRVRQLHPAAQIVPKGKVEELEGQYLQITPVSAYQDLEHPIYQ